MGANTSVRRLAILAAAALFGAAAGVFLGYEMKPVPPPQEPVKTDDTELRKAKARISELEKLLAEAKAVRRPAEEKPVAKVEEKKPEAEMAPPDIILLAGGADIDEQLKSQMSDTEYGVVSNVFAAMRERRAERSRGRIGFLESVDTSKMCDADRANHERYLELLAMQEKYASKTTGLVPDMATLAKQVELQMELEPLAKNERSILLTQMTDDLGYSGEDAEVIHDTIGDIYEATSSRSGISGMISTVIDDIGMEKIAAPGAMETPPVVETPPAPEN